MKSFRFILIYIGVLLIASCSPSLPDGILSKGEMEDIVYDLHIAHYLPASSKLTDDDISEGARQHAFLLQILKKHGVTEKEWDNSMIYYTRHAELLVKVYDNVYERIKDDAQAMGIAVEGFNMVDSNVDGLDSTNVWNMEKEMLLTSYYPNNSKIWNVTGADSIMQKGEKITLTFNSQYLNARAYQKGTALIAVTLDNDSTVQQSITLSGNGTRSLTMTCPSDYGIKNIRGLFILEPEMVPHSISNNTTDAAALKSSQALFISNIKLLHQAPTPPPPAPEEAKPEAPDSTKMEEKEEANISTEGGKLSLVKSNKPTETANDPKQSTGNK